MITLDQVLSGRNILRATKQVVSNKGAPGIDGMTVDQYEAHHRRHWRSIAEHIRAGSYIPAPVRRVDIPKPNGGTRMLGIPTVQDRVIQQAIAQILVEAYDPPLLELKLRVPPWPKRPRSDRTGLSVHQGGKELGGGDGLGKVLRHREPRPLNGAPG